MASSWPTGMFGSVPSEQSATQLSPFTELSESIDRLSDDQALGKPYGVLCTCLTRHENQPSHLLIRELDGQSSFPRGRSRAHFVHPRLLSCKQLCYILSA